MSAPSNDTITMEILGITVDTIPCKGSVNCLKPGSFSDWYNRVRPQTEEPERKVA